MKYLTDINKRNHDLKNQWYVESIKQENVVRILALNPRGFGPKNKEKINMLKKAMVEWKIDVVLMSSTDRRWTEMKLDQMKKQMRSVNKNVEIIASDSREKTRNEDGYLPGGIMAIFIGKIAGMIAKEHNKKDTFSRWTSTRIENGRNKMQIINVYRIPDSTQSRILKSRAQYDRVRGEVKSSK